MTIGGGVNRISGLINEKPRGVLEVFLEIVIGDGVTYTVHAKRIAVTVLAAFTRSEPFAKNKLLNCSFCRSKKDLSMFFSYWETFIKIIYAGMR